MERLTKEYKYTTGTIVHERKYTNVTNQQLIDKLAEYEIAEEQGLLLRLPCKVGDTVYVIPSQVNYDLNILSRYTENNRVYEQVVDSMRMWRNGKYCLSTCEGLRLVLSEYFGETWFLTREEAENALAGLAKTSAFAEKGDAE